MNKMVVSIQYLHGLAAMMVIVVLSLDRAGKIPAGHPLKVIGQELFLQTAVCKRTRTQEPANAGSLIYARTRFSMIGMVFASGNTS